MSRPTLRAGVGMEVEAGVSGGFDVRMDGRAHSYDRDGVELDTIARRLGVDGYQLIDATGHREWVPVR